MRTVSLASALEDLLSAASREKTAKISTDPKTFFVHVRVPDHVADNLREIQRKVIPDASKHEDIDHVTLVYTRKPDDDHPPEKVHAALSALRQVGEKTEPIHAKIQGWGYFDGASSGGKPSTALVALLDAPGLEHLHVDMSRALATHGIKPSDLHIFTPHITLGYLGDKGRAEGELPPIDGKFTIDRAHVAARDHHEVELTGREKSLGEKAASYVLKQSEIDSMKALTESMYATHGPDGVMQTINANPHLRSPMLSNVKTLAGAASQRPQHGMFSGVMQTQATPLRNAVSGTIMPKLAARAGMRAIQQHINTGDMGAANQLATTPGVLKPSAAGSQIKHLGSGREGTSTLVAHPEHGVAVRKVYDPQGVSGPQMVTNKAEAGTALRGNPYVAEFKGEAPTHIGPAHFYEHVPNVEGPRTPSSFEVATRVRGEQPNGMRLHDVHEGNIQGGKAVDYLPIKPGGVPNGLRLDVMERAEAAHAAMQHGEPHAFTNYMKDPARPGNLMAQAFRGAKPLVQQDSPVHMPKRASLGEAAAAFALENT